MAAVEAGQLFQGSFGFKPLNKIDNDKLGEEMARLLTLPMMMLWELSHRSIFSAWKKGAVLWILNDQSWSKSIGDFAEWFTDLWSKVKVFGDMFKTGDGRRGLRSGPKTCRPAGEFSTSCS